MLMLSCIQCMWQSVACKQTTECWPTRLCTPPCPSAALDSLLLLLLLHFMLLLHAAAVCSACYAWLSCNAHVGFELLPVFALPPVPAPSHQRRSRVQQQARLVPPAGHSNNRNTKR
jgi:hypothetical protein